MRKLILALIIALVGGAAHAQNAGPGLYWQCKSPDASAGTPAGYCPVSAGYPLPVNTTPVLATYSAATTALVAANSATDIACLSGSATKIVRISRLRVSGTATANTAVPVSLVLRSTAATGGTSSTLTAVPNDSSESAATAVMTVYTANPTVGTLIGALRAQTVIIPGGATPNLVSNPVHYEFGQDQDKLPTLRGATQSLCVNLNSTTVAGNSLSISIEWTEDTNG